METSHHLSYITLDTMVVQQCRKKLVRFLFNYERMYPYEIIDVVFATTVCIWSTKIVFFIMGIY